MALVVSSADAEDPANPTLFLVDSQFSDLRTYIFRVDPLTGALEVRADLGATYSPVLGLAAASRNVLYLTATDTGPLNVCQGDFACLLLKVELDPLSTTPGMVQVVGTIQEGDSLLGGVTGLSFRRDGKLYAISQNTNGLYLLDLETAAATRIGTIDLELHGGDLTFDGSDRLWIWSNIGAGTGLYLTDPTTCHASAFDLHPFLDMAGFAALGHGDSLRGASPLDDRLYEADAVLGFTGISAPLTLNGQRFDHRRGDLDSPFCETDESCADENPCTIDVCAPGGCLHTPVSEPVACDDGNLCTQADSCQAGVCAGADPVVCGAPDACHDAGTCNPASGACENAPAKADGASCDDGNLCTQADSCQAGVCAGADPVVCGAPDACHDAGTCNPVTGSCDNAPAKADGSSCDDGNFCTSGDVCQGGACLAGSPRDSDGDGRVDSVCGGTDCSDLDPFVWAAPLEVANMRIDASTPSGLAWDSLEELSGPGTTYDLISGRIQGTTGHSLAPGLCLQAGGGNRHIDNRPEPDSGAVFWYLVRGSNACGVGSFGSVQRDQTAVSCP
jgi:slime mold repeat-containing protein